MDLWIMGSLYKLIVRGSGLHDAFGEKGLDRSVYPIGGMRGRSPVFGLGVYAWEDKQEVVGMGDRKKCEGRERSVNANPAVFLLQHHQTTPKRPERTVDFSDLSRRLLREGSSCDLS